MLSGWVSRDDRDCLFRMVKAMWPRAVWEDAGETGNPVSVERLWTQPGNGAWTSPEFFLHETLGSQRFIHVLVSRDCLTLVVDRDQIEFADGLFEILRIDRPARGQPVRPR